MVSKSRFKLELSPRDARLLPLLLMLAVAAAFTPSLLGRYQEVRAKGEEVMQKKQEVESLRQRLAELSALRQRLARLEEEYGAVSWPPDPRTQGAAWMAALLEGAGLKVENMEISGGDPFAEGLLSVNVAVRGKAPGYGAVREGLKRLLDSRSVIRSVRLEYAAGQGLSFDFKVGVLVPLTGAAGGKP